MTVPLNQQTLRGIFVCLAIAFCILILATCSKKMDTQQSSGSDSTKPRLSADSNTLHVSNRPQSLDSFSISSNIQWTVSLQGDAANVLLVSTTAGLNNQKIIVTTQYGNLTDTVMRGIITLSGPNDSIVHPVVISITQKPLVSEFPVSNVYGGSRGGGLLFGLVSSGDGGIVAIGQSYGTQGDPNGNHGSNDMWVIKVDSSGKRSWQRLYGGSNDDIGNSIINTKDGGYLGVGWTYSNNFDAVGNHGGLDVLVVKMDASGNKIWSKCYGTSTDEDGYAAVETTDGGFIITGGTNTFSLFKIDGNGNVIWQNFGNLANVRSGDWISTGVGGGYIVVGRSVFSAHPAPPNLDVVDTGYGRADVWMAKIDENGNFLWNREFGGFNEDFPHFVQTTTDGGYLITGHTNTFDTLNFRSHGGDDFLIIKTDTSGSLQWLRTFGGGGNDQGWASTNSYEGGYIVGGYASGYGGDISNSHGGIDGWTLKLDPSGNLISQKTFGGSSQDYIFFVNHIGNQKYAFVGYSQSYDGDILGASGYGGGWIMRFD